MYNGLYIGRSGLNASQRTMDNISDKISNSSTTGYKEKEMVFNELLHTSIAVNGDAVLPTTNAGSKSMALKIDFNQGPIFSSKGELDLAIEGRGFFGVRDASGDLLLTRNGAFKQDAQHTIVDDFGNLLEVELVRPYDQWPGADRLGIDQDGNIMASDENGSEVLLGRIMLYAHENESRLTSVGNGCYSAAEAELISSTDQDGLFGTIHQGFLEGSNADLTESLTEMITIQKMYSMNARSITTADDMLGVINDIL